MGVSRTLLDQFMDKPVNIFGPPPRIRFYDLSSQEVIEGCYAQGILLPNWIGNRPVVFTSPFSDPLTVVHRHIDFSRFGYDFRPMCTVFSFESIMELSIEDSALKIFLDPKGYETFEMDDFDEEGEDPITRLLMKKQV